MVLVLFVVCLLGTLSSFAFRSSTYTGGETVAVDIDGLDQGGLLEGDRRSGGLGDRRYSIVEAKGRGGGRKDGKKCKRSDLHFQSSDVIGLAMDNDKDRWLATGAVK